MVRRVHFSLYNGLFRGPKKALMAWERLTADSVLPYSPTFQALGIALIFSATHMSRPIGTCFPTNSTIGDRAHAWTRAWPRPLGLGAMKLQHHGLDKIEQTGTANGSPDVQAIHKYHINITNDSCSTETLCNGYAPDQQQR